tara:strand:- start:621 stop:1118 length:498 start_codon:yes stop_codon:yes gene_type:complete
VAKLTKKVIKSIVKECLVEILSEGIGAPALLESNGDTRPGSRKSLNSSVGERQKSSYRRRMGLDKIQFGNSEGGEVKNENFEKNIKGAASAMTSDPVLSSILADTARTTLQEQLGAESTGPGGASIPSSMAGDAAERIVANSNPEEMFGESASKWAQLAFADKVN